jgi:hypothetical protein
MIADLRQARRTRLLTRSALVVLTVLTVTAFVSAALAPFNETLLSRLAAGLSTLSYIQIFDGWLSRRFVDLLYEV